MRKKIVGMSLVIGIAVIGFIAGPRETLDKSVIPVSLPQDLDTYLLNQEKGIELTTPDVAKQIVWANPTTKSKTPVSIVYLHGYSATLKEINPVTRLVAEHFKANVFYTRLAGHGEGKESFGRAKASDWMQDTLEAWEIGKAIGNKVILVGTSTGATLGTWLAMTQQVDELKALVFVSPNYEPADKRAGLLLWPWGVPLGTLINGSEYRSWKPANEKQGRYWETNPSIKSSAQLMLLVHMVDQLNLSSLDIPTLILYSERDDVVSVPKIKQKFQAIASKQKRIVEIDNHKNPSKHVLAGDIVGMNTTQVATETIIQFLEKNLTL